MNTARNVYLNAAGSSYHFVDAQGARIDSFAGPREFMIGYGAASGWAVHDEQGRKLDPAIAAEIRAQVS